MSDVPTHLMADACYICGGGPHEPTLHKYWSNADVDKELDREDSYLIRYNLEATYVAEHRPY